MSKYSVQKNIPKKADEELKNYPKLARHLLFHRGIKTAEEAEKFLNPNYDAHTHDPFSMKDMDKAVERVLRAIKENEKVAIWSDYDADGIPGGVILHDFFKKIGFKNFENHIPDRNGDGFGLNKEAVQEFGKNKVKLLITVDCGITGIAEILEAKKLGMDVIITDHHLPAEILPEAFAILNPKQKDCWYPEKMLCGAGVIFKLVQALASRINSSLKIENCKLKIAATFPIGWEKWLLDMVGIATLSDMVPLTGENRVFAYYGLKVLRKTPRLGLKKLLQKIRVDQRTLAEDDIGFSISPRINAASRMGIAMDAFKLLTAENENEAEVYADHLDKINNERKGVVAAMVKEMKKIVSERYADPPKIIVLGNPKWKPSLVGLAAGTLAEEHSCPVFIWGREGESTIKGSCRSDGSVSLVEMMQKTKEGIFIDFGGHHLSGGFSVKSESVHILEEELLAAHGKIEKEDGDIGKIPVDAKMEIDEVNDETFGILEKLSPFGIGNEKPLFLFENIRIDEANKFGKENGHLKLIFKNTSGRKIPAIAFFVNENSWGVPVDAGQKINMVANLEKSYFGNRPEIRLRIVDIF